MKDLKKVGALWIQHSESGRRYLSGTLELTEGQKLKVVVFRNDYKAENEKAPDYQVYLKGTEPVSKPYPDDFLEPEPPRGQK